MANYLEKREHPRIKVKRPITIFTDKGEIEGESRNITDAGIFLHCREHLRKDEVYRMIIRFPEKKSIEVKGKLMWSNLDGIDPNGTFTGMGFSFIKISEKDRHLMNDVFSMYVQG